MRMIALAAAALALSACGGESGGSADTNAGTENMMMDDNMMLDSNASMNGMDAMGGMGGMDANASANGADGNMMMKDAATNDADTNLANGL